MSQNVYDILMERGFIEQATHEDEIREMLGKESVTFYIGFDATADSLTAGHFLTIMAMMHMQRCRSSSYRSFRRRYNNDWRPFRKIRHA